MKLPNEERSWKPGQRSAIYDPMIDNKPKKARRSVDLIDSQPTNEPKQRALFHERSGQSRLSDT